MVLVGEVENPSGGVTDSHPKPYVCSGICLPNDSYKDDIASRIDSIEAHLMVWSQGTFMSLSGSIVSMF